MPEKVLIQFRIAGKDYDFGALPSAVEVTKQAAERVERAFQEVNQSLASQITDVGVRREAAMTFTAISGQLAALELEAFRREASEINAAAKLLRSQIASALTDPIE